MQEDTLKNDLTSMQVLADEYLKEIGFSRVSTQHNTLTMSKKFIVDGHSTEIIVTIDKKFPLIYPKFYIKEKSLFLKYPHIEQVNPELDACSICLIQEDQKVLYENPTDLLFDVYNELERFLSELNNGKLSQNEIFEEFDSYWNYTNLVVHFNRELFKENTRMKLVDFYISTNAKQNLGLIDASDKIDTFFQAIGQQYRKEKILYINFGENFPSKVPINYKEFLELIKNVGYLKTFHNFKKRKDIFNVILFSFMIPSTNEKHFAALHVNANNKKLNPISIILNKFNSNVKLIGGIAKDISNTRIYSRGGRSMNVEISKKKKKIGIIGCGSIGASLSYKLSKSGCTDLVLIDNDILSVDNIARHQLGMEYVNISKTEAMKNFLEKQFIGINIESIPKKVENCVNDLKDCDLIISALGSEANIIEEELIKDSINEELPPIISCWLEANAVAGHAILFDTKMQDLINKSGFFKMSSFFNSLSILNSDYANSLQKNDVGCNANYMPYSFIDADLHTNRFAQMIIQYIVDGNIKNIWSSIGDISSIQEHLVDEKSIEPYSLYKKDVA